VAGFRRHYHHDVSFSKRAEGGDSRASLGIAALSFTPDSRFLISASADGTVKVWRVLDGVKEGCFKAREEGKDKQEGKR